MSDQGDLFSQPANKPATIPCHRGGHVCSWPACASDCDGRPGRAQPDNKPDNPRKKRLEWFEQPYETRANKIESIAAQVDKYPAKDAEHAQYLREHADHLRALAQRMRTEKRPLA